MTARQETVGQRIAREWNDGPCGSHERDHVCGHRCPAQYMATLGDMIDAALSAAPARVDHLRGELSRTIDSRRNLQVLEAERIAENDRLRRDVGVLTVERDSLRDDRHHTTEEWLKLFRRLSLDRAPRATTTVPLMLEDVLTERDVLKADLARTTAERDAAVEERERLCAELGATTIQRDAARVLAARLRAEVGLLTRKIITCGVAADHPDATLSRRAKDYGGPWDSPQAQRVRQLRADRDALAAACVAKDHASRAARPLLEEQAVQDGRAEHACDRADAALAITPTALGAAVAQVVELLDDLTQWVHDFQCGGTGSYATPHAEHGSTFCQPVARALDALRAAGWADRADGGRAPMTFAGLSAPRAEHGADTAFGVAGSGVARPGRAG